MLQSTDGRYFSKQQRRSKKMLRLGRYLAILVVILGVACIAIGGVFVAEAIGKNHWITSAMRQEQITLGLSQEQIAKGDVIDTAQEAQAAADKIKEDRRAIFPTYSDLLAASGGKFDPTNPKDLSYAQALNMENYLYLAVLGFGVTTATLGTGVFMLVTGVALGAIGVVWLRFRRMPPPASA
jgi:hypothetical protein